MSLPWPKGSRIAKGLHTSDYTLVYRRIAVNVYRKSTGRRQANKR
jgi:hypothetical protein